MNPYEPDKIEAARKRMRLAGETRKIKMKKLRMDGRRRRRREISVFIPSSSLTSVSRPIFARLW